MTYLPSPPASVEQHDEYVVLRMLASQFKPCPGSHLIIFDKPEFIHGQQSSTTSSDAHTSTSAHTTCPARLIQTLGQTQTTLHFKQNQTLGHQRGIKAAERQQIGITGLNDPHGPFSTVKNLSSHYAQSPLHNLCPPLQREHDHYPASPLLKPLGPRASSTSPQMAQ